MIDLNRIPFEEEIAALRAEAEACRKQAALYLEQARNRDSEADNLVWLRDLRPIERAIIRARQEREAATGAPPR